jgi:hypothetical protein
VPGRGEYNKAPRLAGNTQLTSPAASGPILGTVCDNWPVRPPGQAVCPLLLQPVTDGPHHNTPEPAAPPRPAPPRRKSSFVVAEPPPEPAGPRPRPRPRRPPNTPGTDTVRRISAAHKKAGREDKKFAKAGLVATIRCAAARSTEQGRGRERVGGWRPPGGAAGEAGRHLAAGRGTRRGRLRREESSRPQSPSGAEAASGEWAAGGGRGGAEWGRARQWREGGGME